MLLKNVLMLRKDNICKQYERDEERGHSRGCLFYKECILRGHEWTGLKFCMTRSWKMRKTKATKDKKLIISGMVAIETKIRRLMLKFGRWKSIYEMCCG